MKLLKLVEVSVFITTIPTCVFYQFSEHLTCLACLRLPSKLPQTLERFSSSTSPLNNQRPSPQYLLEDELDAAQEPTENYLEELPGKLPPAMTYSGRPLYDLLDLGDLLARRRQRRRREAEDAPPAA